MEQVGLACYVVDMECIAFVGLAKEARMSIIVAVAYPFSFASGSTDFAVRQYGSGSQRTCLDRKAGQVAQSCRLVRAVRVLHEAFTLQLTSLSPKIANVYDCHRESFERVQIEQIESSHKVCLSRIRS